MRWLATLLGLVGVAYASLALYLYVFQARFIYFPDLPSRAVDATPAAIGLAFEAVALRTADGESLTGWFVPSSNGMAGARATLLFLHGNAGNIGHRLDPIAEFHRLGLNVLIIDYRGYGASSGKPGEEGTYQDALAAWNFLTQKKGIQPGQIVLFGESLGGSIAAWLAARHTPKALIIFASFTSVPEFAQELYPIFPARWLARFQYDTRAALRQVLCPVMVMHSPEDEIIPFRHGLALFAVANTPKQFLELRGGHNDALLVSRETYVRGMAAFLGLTINP